MIRKIRRSGCLYVVPAFLVVALVMLYPLLYTLVTGFYEKTLMQPKAVFAGFGQYRELLSEPVFLGSIAHTFVWTFGSVSLQFLLGFAMALLLHQSFVKGQNHTADSFNGAVGASQHHRLLHLEMDVQCGLRSD